jgi:hypothetical protein
MSLVKVTKKNGEVIHVLPEEVPGLKEAGLLKEEKQPGQTKEEKSVGETKVTGKVKTDPPKKRPVNISHDNIKGASPKKT